MPSSENQMQQPARRSDVLEYPVDREAVLLDPASQSMVILNESAASIWRMCDGRTSAQQMAESHTRCHAVDIATAHEDIDRLLGGLAAVHLLVEAPTGCD